MKRAMRKLKVLIAAALCVAGICVAQAYVKPGISINGKIPKKDGKYSDYTYQNGVFTLNRSGTYTFAGADRSGKVSIVAKANCTIQLKDGFVLDLSKKKESSGETTSNRSPISLSGAKRNVHVIAAGEAYLYGAKRGAGLCVTGKQTVYVESQGSGCLHAYGGKEGAGIGSGCNDNGCGTIYIRGKVEAVGGKMACGIGMGDNCTGNGTIRIDKITSDVKAIGYKAPAIGACGKKFDTVTIKIVRGKVVANVRNGHGAAIGTGKKSSGNCEIVIAGGRIDATVEASGGAGIGTGDGSRGETEVTISGGHITARGGLHAAGIGGGYNAIAPTIMISGGTIEAQGDPDDPEAMDIGVGTKGTGTKTCEVFGGSIKLNKGKGHLTRVGTALNCITVYSDKKHLKELGAEGSHAEVSLRTSRGVYYSDDIVYVGIKLYLWVPPDEYTFTVTLKNGEVLKYYADVRNGSRTIKSSTISYVVSFNGNGGSPTPESVQRDGGMAFGPLSAISPTPTWPNSNNYKFLGWFTRRDGGAKLTSDTIIQGNCTYYARWRAPTVPDPVECVIHFYGLNSEVFTSITGERGKAIGPLPVLEKPGYRFKGWKRSGDSVTLKEDTTFDYTLDYASPIWEEITATANGYTWRYCVENGEAIIVKSESWHQPAVTTSPSGAVTVPSTLGGYPVTTIGDAAFYDCSGITSVTIPATVTTIGDYAFYKCTGLTTVNIPESVTTIGDDAFCSCTGLRRVTGMAGVKEIGYMAFYNTALTELTLPEGVETIGNGAFSYCKSLATVNIPASLTDIGAEAFIQCTGLTNLNLAEAERRYGVRAFCGCPGLADGDFVVVDGILFYYLGSDSHVIVPAGVWRIDDTAFPGKKFTSVTLPESLNSLGVNVFSGTGLKTVLFALDAGTVDDKAAQIDRIKSEFSHAGVNVDNLTFAVPTAGVTFYGNGGTPAYSEEDRPVGVELGELPVATRTGYLFLGWYTAYGTQATATTIATGDDVFFAKWTPAWTVSLNANAGTVSPAKVLIAKGKAVGSALPKPTRTGYTFVAWYTKKSGGSLISSKTKFSKNVTIYAHWTPNKYPITLLKEGSGNVSGGGNKAYKSKVTLKATPSSGWVFHGWYLGNTLMSQKASYAITVPLDGATYTAWFVTKDDDKASIGMELGGVGVGSLETVQGATLPAMSATCGVITTWPVTAAAYTPVSVTVTGLPKGMKYDANKKAITGVPSASGSGTMTITVKSSGGSKAWDVQWTVAEMPTKLRGAFNGWTYTDDNSRTLVRKVTVTVTSAGKLSASVGPLKFAATGWTARDDGHYEATFRTLRKVVSGSKTKKFTDVLTLDIDPGANWMTDQLDGTLGTYAGDVTVAKAQTLTPSNKDVVLSARRNPYNDADDVDGAKELAAEFSLWLGTGNTFVDESGITWNVKASTAGVVTISRTTGSGKNKKTITATAVLEVDDFAAYRNYSARFLVSGKVIGTSWQIPK